MSRLRDDGMPMGIVDLLLPPACAGCGDVGALFCRRCAGRLRPPFDARDRFVLPDAGVVIGDRLAVAIAAWAYEGPMRRALAALKYGGAGRLAPILADLSLPALDAILAVTGPAALVPVPVHLERRRARGYDQAELLATRLGRRRQVALLRALVRVRPTTKQHRLNRAERLRNLRDAFRVRPGLRAPPVAILVDDIVTTTATLEACATVLRAAGCTMVAAVAVAREV